MAKILDGNRISSEIRSEMKTMLATRRSPLTPHRYDQPKPPTAAPALAVVLCSNDPASRVYVKKKIEACNEIGINSSVICPFENGINNWTNPREHLLRTIDYLNSDLNIHGILVQLPLPQELGITNYEIFDRIDPRRAVELQNMTALHACERDITQRV